MSQQLGLDFLQSLPLNIEPHSRSFSAQCSVALSEPNLLPLSSPFLSFVSTLRCALGTKPPAPPPFPPSHLLLTAQSSMRAGTTDDSSLTGSYIWRRNLVSRSGAAMPFGCITIGEKKEYHIPSDVSDKYDLGQIVKSEEFCEIFRAKDKTTMKMYTCKKFLKKDGRKVRKAAKNEILILK
ncbi:unnamed protein product, partial [Pleuronectes platessa]